MKSKGNPRGNNQIQAAVCGRQRGMLFFIYPQGTTGEPNTRSSLLGSHRALIKGRVVSSC